MTSTIPIDPATGRPRTLRDEAREAGLVAQGEEILADTVSCSAVRHSSSVRQDSRYIADIARDLPARDMTDPVSRYRMFGD